eukprot:tig00001576_g9371.t1
MAWWTRPFRGLKAVNCIDEEGGVLLKKHMKPLEEPEIISQRVWRQQLMVEFMKLPPQERPIPQTLRFSALHIAVHRGQTETAAAILAEDKRAANEEDGLRRPPLAYAVAAGNPEITRLLLEAGASHEFTLGQMDRMATSYTLAVDSGSLDVLRLILDYALSARARDPAARPPREALLKSLEERAGQYGSDAPRPLLAAVRRVLRVALADLFPPLPAPPPAEGEGGGEGEGGPDAKPAPPEGEAEAAGPAAEEADGETALMLACRHGLALTAARLAEARPEPRCGLGGARVAYALIARGADLLAEGGEGPGARSVLECTADVEFRAALKRAAGVRDVFISYGHQPPEVAEFARRLRDRLEAAHVTCWLDEQRPSGIEAGTEWREQIGAGIAAAQAVVFVASRHACASEWCRRELSRASDLGRPIFPVWRELSPLDAELQGLLYKTQFADFSDDERFDAAFPAFALTVSQAVNRTGGRRDGRGPPRGASEEDASAAAAAALLASPEARPPIDDPSAPFYVLWCCPADAAFASQLAGGLRERGMAVWVDCPAPSPAGGEQGEAPGEAARAIGACAGFVPLLSAASAGSGLLRDRVQLAELAGRAVWPALLAPLEVPAALEYSLAKARAHAFLGTVALAKNLDALASSMAGTAGAPPAPAGPEQLREARGEAERQARRAAELEGRLAAAERELSAARAEALAAKTAAAELNAKLASPARSPASAPPSLQPHAPRVVEPAAAGAPAAVTAPRFAAGSPDQSPSLARRPSSATCSVS